MAGGCALRDSHRAVGVHKARAGHMHENGLHQPIADAADHSATPTHVSWAWLGGFRFPRPVSPATLRPMPQILLHRRDYGALAAQLRREVLVLNTTVGGAPLQPATKASMQSRRRQRKHRRGCTCGSSKVSQHQSQYDWFHAVVVSPWTSVTLAITVTIAMLPRSHRVVDSAGLPPLPTTDCGDG